MTRFVFARSAFLLLIFRVLVTLLWLSFTLSLSLSVSLLSHFTSILSLYLCFSLAPSLLHSDSVYSTLCHSVLAWCLCNWDCIFRWRGTSIIAQAALLLSVFPTLSLHPPLLVLFVKHCGEQAQTPLPSTVSGHLINMNVNQSERILSQVGSKTIGQLQQLPSWVVSQDNMWGSAADNNLSWNTKLCIRNLIVYIFELWVYLQNEDVSVYMRTQTRWE